MSYEVEYNKNLNFKYKRSLCLCEYMQVVEINGVDLGCLTHIPYVALIEQSIP